MRASSDSADSPTPPHWWGLVGAMLGLAVVIWGAPASAQDTRRREARDLDLGDAAAENDDAEDAGATRQVVQEGDDQVTVYRFTGLDLEGNLRTPSLLYFLSRLRAEFDRPVLPHRTFIPELVSSADESEAFE